MEGILLYYRDEPVVDFFHDTMGQNPSFGSGNMGMIPFLQDYFMEESSGTKFIILLRNPIDWAYTAWHFWCNPLFDGKECTSGGWASHLHGSVPWTP
jgi:hypothetical protein